MFTILRSEEYVRVKLGFHELFYAVAYVVDGQLQVRRLVKALANAFGVECSIRKVDNETAIIPRFCHTAAADHHTEKVCDIMIHVIVCRG